MLKKLRLYLIKLLKAKSNERFEEFSGNCEKWANENMKPKGEFTPIRSRFYFPFGHEKIVFVESRTAVLGGQISSARFAPWVTDCTLQNVEIIGEDD